MQFCQPAGWYLTSKRSPPTFYVSILTDADGCRHYCAVHAFSEPIKDLEGGEVNKGKQKRVITELSDKSEDSSREDLTQEETKRNDEDVDESMFLVDNNDSDIQEHCEPLYAPKCLVLLSRVLDFRVLKVRNKFEYFILFSVCTNKTIFFMS